MITTYGVIYTKPEWTMASAINHIAKYAETTELVCKENDKCFYFTVNNNPEKYETVFLPLSTSVGVIVRDLELPREEEEKKEEDQKEEQKDVSE
jgi:hypothetical protein